MVLDTDAHVLREGPPLSTDQDWVKLILLVKRKEGLPLAEFRERSLGKQADLMLEVPGVRRYLQCHTRDGAYGIGEAVLDAAYLFWFDDLAALGAANESAELQRAEEDLVSIVEPRYIHKMLTKEHWVIGPEAR